MRRNLDFYSVKYLLGETEYSWKYIRGRIMTDALDRDPHSTRTLLIDFDHAEITGNEDQNQEDKRQAVVRS